MIDATLDISHPFVRNSLKVLKDVNNVLIDTTYLMVSVFMFLALVLITINKMEIAPNAWPALILLMANVWPKSYKIKTVRHI